jgi:hypothetical protein
VLFACFARRCRLGGPGAGGLSRSRRYGVLLPLELGHEGAHRAQVDLVEAGVRRGTREESLRLLDEQHVFLGSP